MLRAYIKDLTINDVNTLRSAHIPKIFITCDQADVAPVWDDILQEELNVILETSSHEAVGHWLVKIPDLVVIDIDVAKQDPIDLYKKFRANSVAPILLFLPTHRESKILEAYAAEVDEVIIKPISVACAWPRSRPGYATPG